MTRAILMAASLAVPAVAYAQPDFTGLDVHIGDQITVTDGRSTIRGRLSELFAEHLVVAGHEIHPAAGLLIERDEQSIAECRIARATALLRDGLCATTVYDTRATGTSPRLQAPPSPSAPAGPGFDTSRIHRGQRVSVTEADLTFHGKVKEVWPARLVVGDRAFVPSSDLTVVTNGDSLANGIALGVAIGGVLGAFSSIECQIGGSSEATCIFAPAAVFGAVGALIDYANRDQTVLYGCPKR